MNKTKCFAGAVLMLWAVGGQASAPPPSHTTPRHSAYTPKSSPKEMRAYFRQITSLTSQFNTLIGRYSRSQYQGPYGQDEFVPAKDRKNLTVSQEGQNFLRTHSDYMLKAAQLTAALAAVRVPPECRKAHAGMLSFMVGLVESMRGSYDSIRRHLYKDTTGTPSLIPEPVQAQIQNKKTKQLLAQAEAVRDHLDSGSPDDLDAFSRRLESVRIRYHLRQDYGCQLEEPPTHFLQ